MISRLVAFGSCGGWPEPGRACSGLLVEHEGYRVLLDLGYGTLPRLLTQLGSAAADGLDAVVVTHHHPDHAVDLHGLLRARWFGARGAARLPLYAPEGVVRLLTELEDGDRSAVDAVFEWHRLPGDYELGPFALTSVALPHFVPNAGVRLTAPGLTLAYTGDTGPCAELADLGRDADLFVIEATDRHQQPDQPAAPPGPPLLMTGTDAGRAATAAGARRVLLTHFWPGNDRAATARDCAREFGGEVLLADEGLEVVLS